MASAKLSAEFGEAYGQVCDSTCRANARRDAWMTDAARISGTYSRTV
jgi:hypothetical protein